MTCQEDNDIIIMIIRILAETRNIPIKQTSTHQIQFQTFRNKS